MLKKLMSQFEALYRFVSTNGKLSLDQFLRLALHEEANKFFVDVIREVGSPARGTSGQVRAKKSDFSATEFREND